MGALEVSKPLNSKNLLGAAGVVSPAESGAPSSPRGAPLSCCTQRSAARRHRRSRRLCQTSLSSAPWTPGRDCCGSADPTPKDEAVPTAQPPRHQSLIRLLVSLAQRNKERAPSTRACWGGCGSHSQIATVSPPPTSPKSHGGAMRECCRRPAWRGAWGCANPGATGLEPCTLRGPDFFHESCQNGAQPPVSARLSRGSATRLLDNNTKCSTRPQKVFHKDAHLTCCSRVRRALMTVNVHKESAREHATRSSLTRGAQATIHTRGSAPAGPLSVP